MAPVAGTNFGAGRKGAATAEVSSGEPDCISTCPGSTYGATPAKLLAHATANPKSFWLGTVLNEMREPCNFHGIRDSLIF